MECSTSNAYLELGQQSVQDKEQSNSQGDDDSLPVTGEVHGSNSAGDEENLADLEKRIVTTYCSQTSDTTTITLSSPSAITIRTDSQDLDKASTVEKECQTMDGVFLSVDEYATLLKKASFSPNFRDEVAKIRSHIAHIM